MRVWRLPRIPIAPLRYALNFPLFVNPVWLGSIDKLIRRTRPDLILSCDLPLAPCAVWFGRYYGIPVHFDMGEVYPEFLRSLRMLERQGPIKRFVRTPGFADRMERYVLRRVSAVYVVSEESRARCVRLGVPPEKLVIVGNTPDNIAALRTPMAPPADLADLVRDGLDILLFVGILIADRGVVDVIRAFPRILADQPRTALVVVGDGPARPELEAAARNPALRDRVRVLGWKAPEELPGYYQASRIGLIPFRDSPHVRITLANKLFDYLATGLPVLASDLPPNRRILEESGAGRLHRSDDPVDLARTAIAMLADTLGLAEMRQRALHAADSLYSWECDAARLCRAVETLRHRPERSTSD